MTKGKLIIFASLFVALVIGGGLALHLYRKKPKMTPQEYYAIGQKKLDDRDFGKAWGYFKRAVEMDPKNSEFQITFAKLAYVLNQKAEARKAVVKAWDYGQRNRETLGLLVALKEGSVQETLKYSMDKLELSTVKGTDAEDMKASFYHRAEKHQEALKIWQDLFSKKPESSLLNKIVNVMVVMEKKNELINLLSEYRRTSLMDDLAYRALVQIYAEDENFVKVEEIFSEMKELKMYSTTERYFNALLHFNRGDLDKALQLFSVLHDPGLVHSADILKPVKLVEFMKGEQGGIASTLYSAIDSKVLDKITISETSRKLSRSVQKSLLSQELNRVFMKSDLFSDELLEKEEISMETKNMFKAEHKNNLRLAYKQLLLEKLGSYVVFPEKNEIALQSRLHSSFIYVFKNEQKELQKLKSWTDGKKKYSEAEHLFYDDLLAQIEGKPSENAFQKPRKLISGHPIVEFFYGRHLNKRGDFNEAMRVFRIMLTKNKNYNRNPYILTELARSMMALNQNREAIGVLSEIHRRKIYSKESLLLYRDLMLKTNNEEESWKIQEYLDKTFQGDAELEWERAMLSMQTRRYKEATNIIEHLSEKFPNDEKIEIARLTLYLAKQKFTECIEACKASELGIDKLNLIRAQAYIGLKNYEKASELLKKVNDDVVKPVALKTLAGLHVLKGQWEKANSVFDEVLMLKKEDVKAMYGKALASFQMKKLGDAKQLIDQILKLNSEEVDTMNLNAQVLFQKGQIYEVIQQCDKTLALDTKNVMAKYLKGRAMVTQEFWGEAEKAFADLCLLEPGQPIFKLEWIRSLVALKKYARALMISDEMIDKFPDSIDAKTIRLRILALAGKFSAAEKTLMEIKDQLTEEFYVLNKLWLLELQSKIKDAVELASQHLSHKSILHRWAVLKMKIKNAEGVLEKIMKSDLLSQVYLNIGIEAHKMKFDDLAVKCYELGLLKDPNNPILMNNLAWSWAKLNHPKEKVLALVKTAMEKLAFHVEVLDTYVYVLYKYKEYDEIINVINQRMNECDNHARLLYHLARAYDLKGDIEAAKSFYATSARLQNVKHYELDMSVQMIEERVSEIEAALEQKQKKKKLNN